MSETTEPTSIQFFKGIREGSPIIDILVKPEALLYLSITVLIAYKNEIHVQLSIPFTETNVL